MLCQECQERPATMQVTKFMNGEKTEVNLCEQCAHEQSELFMFHDGGNMSFNNLLAGLLNMGMGVPGTSHGTKTGFSQDEPTCPHCQLTYREFVNSGRFGCAQCYETFEQNLEPVLKRLQGGNVRHHGKIPRRVGGTLHIRKQINDLKEQLKGYIEAEEFEKAAQTRDDIRALEREISSSQEGGEPSDD